MNGDFFLAEGNRSVCHRGWQDRTYATLKHTVSLAKVTKRKKVSFGRTGYVVYKMRLGPQLGCRVSMSFYLMVADMRWLLVRAWSLGKLKKNKKSLFECLSRNGLKGLKRNTLLCVLFIKVSYLFLKDTISYINVLIKVNIVHAWMR